MKTHFITTPISDAEIKKINAGDEVIISGKIYTARDAAHARMVDGIKRGEAPPFDFNGRIVFYAGPSPAGPGRVIGSVGPTTAGRMDAYAPFLIERGLKIMIGKGKRSVEVIEAIKKNNGIYLAAIGGAAALLSECVKEARIIAYGDLGAEAVYELIVEDFPTVAAVDHKGNSVYK